ncbi:tyrosine-type recombinase/integrase [Phaeobacter sp. SYSU ZJ3003]|uniref:tyrosine-type recombinase/integrase n=1 Tax=Phaeobacter sp. SYSU ZJ3003 TaxID=2109330 RepID=UPI00351C86E7
MARTLNRLTAKEVEKKKAPGLYSDGGGLYLQITKAGVKSWLFRYMINGTPYGMGLGPTHTVTLADARERAMEARKLKLKGINPLEAKREAKLEAMVAQAKLMTFDQCASAYIEAHRSSWKNAKHADQWSNTITTYVSPIIGALPVAQVDTALVLKVLTQEQENGQQFWQAKNETAKRVRGRMESILGWATTSGARSGENPARWKGHLENLLAAIDNVRTTKNHPSLPWQRVGGFVQEIRQREGMATRALEFTLLTAARSGEVRGAMWSEIDLAAKIWTIPAARMKAKQQHEVPLSPAAISLLKQLPRLEGTDVVFPGTKGQPLSDMSLTAVIRRMNAATPTWVDEEGKTVTVHGFRSTFRMWAAEATNYPREVAEHALAHRLPDAVERAYQRGTQFTKRAMMMKDWADYLGGWKTNVDEKY